MATKSILKTIDIKEKYAARNLVDAIERTKLKDPNKIVIKEEVREATSNDLKKYFKD